MTTATLTWIPGPYISYVSGLGTPVYKVKGIGNGYSNVSFQINTPSGFSWSSTIPFYAGKPVLSNQKVDGQNYFSGYQICPGNHSLTVNVTGEGATNAAWTVPPGIVYYVGTNQLNFTFPSNWPSISISANSTNGCGTTSNTSFYLTRKTSGCTFGMTLYPNPASDIVTIEIEQDPSLETPFNYHIKIYNSQSLLVASYAQGRNKFDIPVYNLNDGTYIIEVTDGFNLYRQQLIIKHN